LSLACTPDAADTQVGSCAVQRWTNRNHHGRDGLPGRHRHRPRGHDRQCRRPAGRRCGAVAHLGRPPAGAARAGSARPEAV